MIVNPDGTITLDSRDITAIKALLNWGGSHLVSQVVYTDQRITRFADEWVKLVGPIDAA